MRPVLHSDVTSAARAVMAVPKQARVRFCARLLQQADWADQFTRRLGKPHPRWGNGTLLAAAKAHVLRPESTFDDPEYSAAFQIVLAQLVARTPAVGL